MERSECGVTDHKITPGFRFASSRLRLLSFAKPLNAGFDFIKRQQGWVWIGHSAAHFGDLLVRQVHAFHMVKVVQQSAIRRVLFVLAELLSLLKSFLKEFCHNSLYQGKWPSEAQTGVLNSRAHRTNSRIARSSPSSVSGYIRPPISCFIMRIDWV